MNDQPITEPALQEGSPTKGGSMPEAKFKVDREAFLRRVDAQIVERTTVKAVYATHMARAAHHFYIAGEAVKNGEFGYADSQHAIAALSLAAAIKALPV